MRRFVYAPKAYAYVKTDYNGIVDLSRYITAGKVGRKVDTVSDAELTIRNPNMVWTKGARQGNPVFRPMDPMTIWLQRVRGYPVQVFTGYLDSTPWLQLYPGTCTLIASCTLKRLLHTYWDPALPFVETFMAQYGWTVNRATGSLYNLGAEAGRDRIDRLLNEDQQEFERLTDGSIGRLLFAVLKHIANWDPTAIHIEALPPQLVENVKAIWSAYNEDAEETKELLADFIKKYIGDGQYGGGSDGGGAGSGSIGDLKGGTNIERGFNFFMDDLGFTDKQAAGAVGSLMGESRSLNPKETELSGGGGYGIAQWTSSGRKSGLLGKANHDTLKVQLAYIREELNGGFTGVFKKMKSARTVESACEIWTNEYEIPGVVRMPERIRYARSVYSSFGGRARDDREKPKARAGSTGISATASASQPDKVRTPANPTLNKAEQERDAERGSTSSSEGKIYSPIKGSPPHGTGAGSLFGGPRPGRRHMGLDIPCPAGTPCIAPFDGEVSVPIAPSSNGFGGHGGMVHIRALKDVAGLKKGQILGWGHASRVRKTGRVRAGTHVADSGWHHVHFVMRSGPGGADGNMDPAPTYNALKKGEQAPGDGAGSDVDDAGGGGGGSGVGYADVLSTAKAAAFVQQFEFPGIAERLEAIGLRGQKSLMNDKPLFPFVEQLSKGAMRQFQSLPNGDFLAFYPDYFGHLGHRKPYWRIRDVEVLDAQIDLSDEALATHVFGVGDTIPVVSPGIDSFDRLISTGTVNIFNVVQSGFNPAPDEANVDAKEQKKAREERLGRVASNPTEVLNFLKKYGARPHLEEAPFVRSPFFEAFLAYQTFQLLWSRQFLTEAQFTFMPELFPGGLIEFEGHGLQVYLDEVTHTFDYENGFTTQVQISAPASTDSAKLTSDPLSFGLVRSSTNVGEERPGRPAGIQ